MLMKATVIEPNSPGSQGSYIYQDAGLERRCYCTSRDGRVSGIAARDISAGEILKMRQNKTARGKSARA